ncbi:MAG: hypothetical protein AMK73_07310 [Planctomycetes bacterium SM23_32]|nr:MAG: hypothetical protein AMK73_07310 [Planctomycetes bacterium SM23_32]
MAASAAAQRGAGRLLLALAGLLALAAAAPTEEPPTAGARAPVPEERIGELLEAVRVLVPESADERRRILSETPGLFALAMLKLEKADLALRLYSESPDGPRAAEANLEEAVAIWGALRQGKRPQLRQSGLLERAYLAANDMSAQPYLLYVPADYDGTEPYGLVVFLHGYSYLNKLNWVALQYSPALETLAEEARCIALVPSGISMGGMGVWTVGGHNPHLFAALIPIASRGDFYMWKGIQRGSLPGFKAKLAEGEFGAELVPNYAHLRCVIVHGLLDVVMPIRQSERMERLLSEAGFEATFVKVEGATHHAWTPMLTAPDVLDCLKAARRDPEPRRITFRTYTLKHGRAYWAEITGIEDWGRPAEMTCELDASGAELAVQTQNVLSLRVRPPAAGGGRLPRIVWNGRQVVPRRSEDGWLALGPEGEQSDAPAKTATLCGPIREAFAEPFILVYGGERGGESFARAVRGAADWVQFAQGVPAVLPASAITPEVVDEFNLILYGTPEDNELMARIAPGLPIGIGGGEYRVGDRTYDASRYGLSIIYPNPLAPERCVVVNCGPVWGAELANNHKYDMLPDFIIFADEKAQDGTDSNRHVCAGFFDQRWRLSEASTWHAPEPSPVEGAPVAPAGREGDAEE